MYERNEHRINFKLTCNSVKDRRLRDSTGELQNTVEGALGLKLSTVLLKVTVGNILKTYQTFERRIPRRLNINYAHYWSDGRIKFKKCWPFCEKRRTEWGIIKIIIVEGWNIGHNTVLSCMSKLRTVNPNKRKLKQIRVIYVALAIIAGLFRINQRQFWSLLSKINVTAILLLCLVFLCHRLHFIFFLFCF